MLAPLASLATGAMLAALATGVRATRLSRVLTTGLSRLPRVRGGRLLLRALRPRRVWRPPFPARAGGAPWRRTLTLPLRFTTLFPALAGGRLPLRRFTRAGGLPRLRAAPLSRVTLTWPLALPGLAALARVARSRARRAGARRLAGRWRGARRGASGVAGIATRRATTLVRDLAWPRAAGPWIARWRALLGLPGTARRTWRLLTGGARRPRLALRTRGALRLGRRRRWLGDLLGRRQRLGLRQRLAARVGLLLGFLFLGGDGVLWLLGPLLLVLGLLLRLLLGLGGRLLDAAVLGLGLLGLTLGLGPILGGSGVLRLGGTGVLRLGLGVRLAWLILLLRPGLVPAGVVLARRLILIRPSAFLREGTVAIVGIRGAVRPRLLGTRSSVGTRLLTRMFRLLLRRLGALILRGTRAGLLRLSRILLGRLSVVPVRARRIRRLGRTGVGRLAWLWLRARGVRLRWARVQSRAGGAGRRRRTCTWLALRGLRLWRARIRRRRIATSRGALAWRRLGRRVTCGRVWVGRGRALPRSGRLSGLGLSWRLRRRGRRIRIRRRLRAIVRVRRAGLALLLSRSALGRFGRASPTRVGAFLARLADG